MARALTGDPPSIAGPDPNGFEGAFRDLFALGYRVAYRMLGDRDAADEIAQESLARAQLHWPGITAEGRPGWVARVAANLAIAEIRRRKRRWRVWSTAVTQTPSDEAVAARSTLVAGLRDLPRRQREVVVLRYLGDLSEGAVASALGISTGAVKQHASRGLAALRSRLELPDP